MRYALVILVVLALCSVAGVAHAQSFSGPIAPNCGTGPCEACHLVKLADNVLRFIIYIATVIATLMLVYAGVLYVSSSANPANIEKAHSIFWNVLIGFIIVLLAWIIVATLLRVFMGEGATLPWNTLTCNVATPTTTTKPGPTIEPIPGYHCVAQDESGCTHWVKDGQTSSSEVLSQDQVVAQWREAGICVTSTAEPGTCYGSTVKSDCPQVATISSGGSTGCTSVNGLRQDTVSSMVDLRSACSCPITVTAGNEPGHQTHQYGYNVDIAQTPGLTTYLKQNVFLQSNFVSNVPGYGPQYRDSSGNCWLVEGNHYHFSQSCRSS